MKKLFKDKSMDDSALVKNQTLGNVETGNKPAPTDNNPKKPNKGTKANAPKRPNIFKRMGRWFKEIGSELKKVTWATFPKTLAQTGVVLMVVAVFFLALLGIDTLFSVLLKLLLGQPV